MSEKKLQTSDCRRTNSRTDVERPSPDSDVSVDDATEPNASADASPTTDGGTTWIELTGFQRDLLKCVRLVVDEATTPTGRTIKEHLESEYGEEINHGRLYQNLNDLTECGCIDKRVVDGRTNAYYLTEEAMEMLDETARQFVSTCGLRRSAGES
ncbi:MULTISPECIES: PadR family transcriptional regulator [Halorussus]|uniref:PadR family transcriptional regulator n=1 Tax=Halorussus TaxID=1070314 RepID=UPI0020A189E5|nr:PadR family transcriptional regulator [Halorussus vallis]USZ74477.1 PadR family transcriptional regulator [Halorussus vallis]